MSTVPIEKVLEITP